MARNNNDWFKFFFRNWLESERVRRMPLAAQGLYLRALCLQAIHGDLPADLEELAMLLHVRFSDMEIWGSVSQHFVVDVTGSEPRLYNPHLREVLVLRERDTEARRKGAESVNAQRDAQRNAQRPQKDNSQRTLRASSSLSISKSSSKKKDKTTKVYSETEVALGKRFAKIRADLSGMKQVKPEAEDYYAGLMHDILTDGEATADDLDRIATWFATTDDGKDSFGYGVCNLARGYKHVLRKNIAMYLAKSRGAFTTPPRGTQSMPEPSPYVSLTGDFT